MTALTQQVISVVAPGKLNLTFDILGKREDGYHEVATVLQGIDLADTIVFATDPKSQFNVELLSADNGSNFDFPLDDTNLICRAFKAFNEFVGTAPLFSLRVLLKKVIPVGGGLAGGSADAAAALIALNTLTEKKLPDLDLLEIAKKVGSDVPFCLRGGTALGLGRGENIKTLTSQCDFHFVICTPKQISVSTPWAYGVFDEQSLHRKNLQPSKGRSENVFRLLENSNHEDAQKEFGNDFEKIIFEHFSYLKDLKEALLGFGSQACHLTGSGPTIYALANDQTQAKRLAEEAKKLSFTVPASDGLRYEKISFDAWVARSCPHGAKVVAAS
jgi:4-diphosphocytidyl-2-C-methyl-D-erythritol kinase